MYDNKDKFEKLYSNKERIIPLLIWLNNLLDNPNVQNAIDKLVKVRNMFERLKDVLNDDDIVNAVVSKLSLILSDKDKILKFCEFIEF